MDYKGSTSRRARTATANLHSGWSDLFKNLKLALYSDKVVVDVPQENCLRCNTVTIL